MHYSEEVFEELLEIMSLQPETSSWRGLSDCDLIFSGHHDDHDLEDFLYELTVYKYLNSISDSKAIEDLRLVLVGIARHWWDQLPRTPSSWTEVICLIRRTFEADPSIHGRMVSRASLCQEMINIMSRISIHDPFSQGFRNCSDRFSGNEDLVELEKFLFNITMYKFNKNVPDSVAIQDIEFLLEGQAKDWWVAIPVKPSRWFDAIQLIGRTFEGLNSF